jgi:hypothetical protein
MGNHLKPPEFEIGDEVVGHIFGAIVKTKILDRRHLGRNRFEYRFHIPVQYIVDNQEEPRAQLGERELHYLKEKQHDWWMTGGAFKKVEDLVYEHPKRYPPKTSPSSMGFTMGRKR